MQSSKMTHWNRSPLWMGSRYKNMTQTAWNRLLSCSPRKTPKKTYNLWKKRIYLYMWEVSYTNKNMISIVYIYIISSWIITVIPLSTHKKSWHPTSESNDQPPLMANKAVPHAASVQVAVSTWLGEPTWISGSIDMSPGGGNLWKSTTIKNKGGSFFKRW